MTALSFAVPLPQRPAGDLPVPDRDPGVYFEGVRRSLPRQAAGTIHRASPAPAVATAANRNYEFIRMVFARAGLPVDPYRPTALVRRVPACLRALEVRTLEEAEARLAARPALVWSLLNTVLLGVTEFCRDRSVFEYLRREVLPALGRNGSRIRIWSAACSEGQELYTVAAGLAGLELLERSELLGTDCRPEAILRARDGEYPAEAAAQFPPGWGRPLLAGGGGLARIHPRLRVAACWRVANLLAGPEAGPWDLILCRNLAIYLEPPVAARLWRQLVDQLAPGGILVTGKAENPATIVPLQRLDACIYRKSVP